MIKHVARVVAAALSLLNTTVSLSVMSGDLERFMSSPLQPSFEKFPAMGNRGKTWLTLVAEASQEQASVASEPPQAALPEVIVRGSFHPEAVLPR